MVLNRSFFASGPGLSGPDFNSHPDDKSLKADAMQPKMPDSPEAQLWNATKSPHQSHEREVLPRNGNETVLVQDLDLFIQSCFYLVSHSSLPVRLEMS